MTHFSKIYRSILLLCVSPIVLLAQKKTDYSKFHNGTFKTTSSVSGNIIIKRQGNFQSEITDKGIKMDFEVKWINENTYTLKPTAVTTQKYKIPAKALLTVTMGKVKGNTFFQITSSNLSDRKAGSDVVKISDQ